MTSQHIVTGMLLVAATVGIHGIGTLVVFWTLFRTRMHTLRHFGFIHNTIVLMSVIVALMAVHLTEVVCWASFYSHERLFPDFTTSLYFSIASYTTVGYGDVVIRDKGWRLLGGVEALAASVPDTNGVVFVPAFVGLGAPHWDPHASGMLIGLGRGTQPGHIARAALEAIAFQVADVLEAVKSETGAFTALRVDGGASVNNLLLQFQADVLGVPVARPQVTETTALGAAYLAGLATGFWPNPDALRTSRSDDARFEPKMSAEERTARRARWHKAVERVRGWNA